MLAGPISGISVSGHYQAYAVVRVFVNIKITCFDGGPKVTPDGCCPLD
jgi:hypothetical protein